MLAAAEALQTSLLLVQVYLAMSTVLAYPHSDAARALSEAEISVAALTGDAASKGLAAKAVTAVAATGASKLGGNLKLFGGAGSKPRPNMTGEDAGPATMVSGRSVAACLPGCSCHSAACCAATQVVHTSQLRALQR